MAWIQPVKFVDALRGVVKESGKFYLYENGRTGRITLRRCPQVTKKPSEKQLRNRERFARANAAAQEWLVQNRPQEDGKGASREYLEMKMEFLKQDKYGNFFNFLVSRMAQQLQEVG